MSDKKSNWSGGQALIAGCIIIAVGFIIAALMFSNAVADRPIQGNFSGSVSAGGYTYPDVMDIYGLQGYLGLYPTSDEENFENYEENYSEIENKLRLDLENSITSGEWKGFPYVQLNGKLYFSKEAVDEWFFKSSNQQLRVE